jgi:hypothetical protein
VIHELGGPPTGDDGTGRAPFVFERLDRPGSLDGLPVRGGPMVQPFAVVAAEEIVGT